MNTRTKSRRYFIIAGELSGDQHGAALMQAISSIDTEASFAGIGGERMKTAGLDALYASEQMAVVGFSEVWRMLPFLHKVMKEIMARIIADRPNRVILIDYPGFNLRLARRLRRSGIPVTYYISPQLWAWRAGRIRSIRSSVDQLLVIFPFEVDWYRQRGVEATFVGHPLLEEGPPELDKEAFCANLGIDIERPILALYPGSRIGEVNRHLELFFESAQLAKAENSEIQIILGLAEGLSENVIPENLRNRVTVEREHPRLVLRYCDLAVVASGTATLEGAVWGVPQVVVYKMSAFSAFLGRWLARLPYYSMVNILAGKILVPEFLQERAQAGPIAKSLISILSSGDKRREMLEGMQIIRNSLEPQTPDSRERGASLTAAQLIVQETNA